MVASHTLKKKTHENIEIVQIKIVHTKKKPIQIIIAAPGRAVSKFYTSKPCPPLCSLETVLSIVCLKLPVDIMLTTLSPNLLIRISLNILIKKFFYITL